MLQFITNTNCATPVADQIIDAINGGCRWVQIRMKDATDNDIREVFHKILDKAKETSTVIIINDRPELAKELGAEGVAGVHLGKNDMSPAKAREFLGPEAIIGVTANTFEDVENVRYLDIDYIGIGPYAYTKTKENLAPVLGIEGIKNITSKMQAAEILIPTVAVGGIEATDVKALLDTGVNGVAVSGAIASAKDIVVETEKFISLLPMDE